MEKMRNPPGSSNCVRYREVSAIERYDFSNHGRLTGILTGWHDK